MKLKNMGDKDIHIYTKYTDEAPASHLIVAPNCEFTLHEYDIKVVDPEFKANEAVEKK